MKKQGGLIYIAIFILLILQGAAFMSLNSKITNLNNEIESTKEKIGEQTLITRDNFNEVSKVINTLSSSVSEQQTFVNQEIKVLKSSQDDFSGVVEDAVKNVVTILTDKSVGSGFFINNDGYIVTNQHVVSDANEIRVLTYDKQEIPAELIGESKLHDVALIKVSITHDVLILADSSTLQVGKKVIAIGNPLGLSFTVTQGIVSALNRVGPNGFREYIQTDVPLNPGNSGGPLIDGNGKVIGMNNFKAGGAENIGFALESNAIRQVINTIANTTLV